MFNQIKVLLQDAQLHQQIKAAKTLDETIKLIMTAGAEKGYTVSGESISRVLSMGREELMQLSEDDLLAVAGGLQCQTKFKSCIYAESWGF